MINPSVRRFLRIVNKNELINAYLHDLNLGLFLNVLDLPLRKVDTECWTSEDKMKDSIYNIMVTELLGFNYPKGEVDKTIDQCIKEYFTNANSNLPGNISKVTGKRMSDSLEGSIERMGKHLPDVLIPDFVKYLKKLEAHPPIAEKRESLWQTRGVWYDSQKRHVMSWMRNQMTHGGEKVYHRDNLNISSRTSYNHWNNPGMALWLLEALGEDPEKLDKVGEEVLQEQNKMKRSGLVRKYFPFDRVIELLSNDPEGEDIIIRTKEELNGKV